MKSKIADLVELLSSDTGNEPVVDLLHDSLQHVESHGDGIPNFWIIDNAGKEVHSQRIHDYLKRNYFQNKDLGAVKNSLNELYYNVFDHADAGGNAFSFIKYDEHRQKLQIVVCDFGTGIAAKIRSHFPEIATDHEAIEKAMEDSFSTHSQSHNAGLGLGNIRNACTDSDALRIISNSGSLYADRKEIIAKATRYEFRGTLVYFDLSLSHFEDEEIITTFEF